VSAAVATFPPNVSAKPCFARDGPESRDFRVITHHFDEKGARPQYCVICGGGICIYAPVASFYQAQAGTKLSGCDVLLASSRGGDSTSTARRVCSAARLRARRPSSKPHQIVGISSFSPGPHWAVSGMAAAHC